MEQPNLSREVCRVTEWWNKIHYQNCHFLPYWAASCNLGFPLRQFLMTFWAYPEPLSGRGLHRTLAMSEEKDCFPVKAQMFSSPTSPCPTKLAEWPQISGCTPCLGSYLGLPCLRFLYRQFTQFWVGIFCCKTGVTNTLSLLHQTVERADWIWRSPALCDACVTNWMPRVWTTIEMQMYLPLEKDRY